MHSPSTPSSPYQFKLGSPSQSRIGSATHFAPYQTSMLQSNPFEASRATFIHSYTQQHSSTLNAPHQSGARHSSNSSNPTSRQKKKRVVTSETLKASKNASRHMEAIRHVGSQSFVQGPRKWREQEVDFSFCWWRSLALGSYVNCFVYL